MSFLKYVLFCFWIFGSPLKAEIIQANSMALIEEKVNTLLKTVPAKDILLAFDVDDTLVSKKNKEAPLLTENSIPQMIKRLQEKGVITIAFTAALSGKNNKGMPREIIRYVMLKNLGIEFHQGIQNFQWVYVEREEDSENEAIERDLVVFYKGILFSNAQNGDPNKGHAIVYFFQKRNLHPQIFIMVDDRRDQLEHIEEALKKDYPNTHFIGIDYEMPEPKTPEPLIQKIKRYWRKFLKRSFEVAAAAS